MQFKIIPQLDRYPWALRHGGRIYGQILIQIFFALGLYLARMPFWMEASAALALLSVFPKKRILLLVISNLAIMTLGGRAAYRVGNGASFEDIDLITYFSKGESPYALEFRVLAVLLFFAFAAGFLAAHRRGLLGKLSPVKILFVVFFSALALASGRGKDHGSEAFLVTALFLNVFQLGFWQLAYTVADQAIIKTRSSFIQVGTLLPFWHFGFQGVPNAPKGFHGHESTIVTDGTERLIWQFKALKLLYWALVLKVLEILLSALIFSRPVSSIFGFDISIQVASLNLPRLFESPFSDFLDPELTAAFTWVSIIMSCLTFLLQLTAQMSVVVSMARLAGFKLFRPVYRPYAATSFFDFLRRIYYYYIEILTRFFFFPFLQLLGRWRVPRSMRMTLAIFLTIVIGGLLLQSMRYMSLALNRNLEVALQGTISRLPYLFALGMICSISSMAHTHKISPAWPRLPRYLPAVVFFLLYCFCYSLQGGWPAPSWQERTDFVLKLLGLG